MIIDLGLRKKWPVLLALWAVVSVISYGFFAEAEPLQRIGISIILGGLLAAGLLVGLILSYIQWDAITKAKIKF